MPALGRGDGAQGGGKVGSWEPAHLGRRPCREEVEGSRFQAQFYSQPALGSPFSWGAKENPVGMWGRGRWVPGLLLSLCIEVWAPGWGSSTCMKGCVASLSLECVLPECPPWAPHGWRESMCCFSPRRFRFSALERVPLEGNRSGIPAVPTSWHWGLRRDLCSLLPLQPDGWPRIRKALVSVWAPLRI